MEYLVAHAPRTTPLEGEDPGEAWTRAAWLKLGLVGTVVVAVVGVALLMIVWKPFGP